MQEKDDHLRKEFDKANTNLKSKMDELTKTEKSIKKYREDLIKLEKALRELEKRFNVVLVKRVDYALFSSKGKKFDEMLMKLSLADKTQIKVWNSILSKEKRVTLIVNQEQEEAESWTSTINEAGGVALIETSLDDVDYSFKKEEYMKEYEGTKKRLENAEKTRKSLLTEKGKAKETLQNIEKEYSDVHLKFKRCEIEISHVKSDKDLISFLRDFYKEGENADILSKLYPEECSLIQAEIFVKNKSDKKGYIRYKGSEISKYYDIFLKLAGDEYVQNMEKAKKLEEEVKNAINSNSLKWSTFGVYGRDVKKEGKPKYNNNETIEYSLLGKETLIIRGKGELPDLVLSLRTINYKGNYWTLNEDLEDIEENILNIIVVGNITSVGEYSLSAFWNQKITVLPESMKRIGYEGIYKTDYCNIDQLKNLKELDMLSLWRIKQKYIFIPKNVKKVNELAFEDTEKRVIFISENTEVVEVPESEIPFEVKNPL